VLRPRLFVVRHAYVASESFRCAPWELECAVVAENHRLHRESSLRYRSSVANHLSESPPSVANHLNEALPAAVVSQSSLSEVPAATLRLVQELEDERAKKRAESLERYRKNTPVRRFSHPRR
jgi:hypothetical protein